MKTETGVLEEQELMTIIARCAAKGLTEKETYKVAQELNSFRVSELLLKGVLNGDVDFVVKEDGDIGYTNPLQPEVEFPEFIH